MENELETPVVDLKSLSAREIMTQVFKSFVDKAADMLNEDKTLAGQTARVRLSESLHWASLAFSVFEAKHASQQSEAPPLVDQEPKQGDEMPEGSTVQ